VSTLAGAPPAPPAAATAALLAGWRERLAERVPRVALADGEDERAIHAAANLGADGVIRPVLFGRRRVIAAQAREHDVALHGATVFDVDSVGGTLHGTLDALHARKPGGDVTAGRSDPLELAVAALRCGLVDACVAGATRTTADVLRSGLRLIGLQAGVCTASSCFLMVLPTGAPVVFADCAVLPEPTVPQLADIAVAAASTYRSLIGGTPRIALLSFSTRGSASHPSVGRVRAATEIVRERMPGVPVDGELQFDAAFAEGVGARKAPGSPVAGQANVFVFPNLDAANIGYKITERIGGAVALGPILQGLRAPLLDLSRGCSVTDLEMLSVISAVRASNRP
jgi:phosphotransacetylase